MYCYIVLAGVAAKARVNAVNAAAPASRATDDLADMVLQNQLLTESDMHIYQTPRRQQQQQQQTLVALL